MSEHKESLVKVLEYLVNDEQDKAADLLHNVFVEKAKNHWSSITEDDEVVEDEISEEDLDETIDLDEADDDSNEDEVEEAINVSDDQEDFLSDIETAEEEIDQEEIMDDEDMDDDAPEMDLAMDMEPEAEEGDEDEAGDAEEAMDNVEDAIAELRAAFADMMDEEPADDMEEPEMEESVEPMEEGATLSAVSVSHSDNSDKASPVAKGAGNAHAKPHPTDTKDGPKASAPAVKDMGVTGPQEAGKLSAAPSAKREDNKSDSPIRGMK